MPQQALQIGIAKHMQFNIILYNIIIYIGKIARHEKLSNVLSHNIHPIFILLANISSQFKTLQALSKHIKKYLQQPDQESKYYTISGLQKYKGQFLFLKCLSPLLQSGKSGVMSANIIQKKQEKLDGHFSYEIVQKKIPENQTLSQSYFLLAKVTGVI